MVIQGDGLAVQVVRLPLVWSKWFRHEHDFTVQRYEACDALGCNVAIEIAACRCEQAQLRVVPRGPGMIVEDER
jgi:hypothetical protein